MRTVRVGRFLWRRTGKKLDGYSLKKKRFGLQYFHVTALVCIYGGTAYSRQ